MINYYLKNIYHRNINSKYIQVNNIKDIVGKDVCIVDDVIASGSTIERCYELIQEYVNSVSILSIAKT